MGCVTSKAEEDVAAPQGGQRPPLKSHLSTKSFDTVDILRAIEIELNGMQEQSEAAAAALAIAACGGELPPVGLRNELAQLHGDANKLLATRIDVIVTGDLETGKEEARARRKAAVAHSERLIETLESQIAELDSIRSAAKDAAAAAAAADSDPLPDGSC